MNNGINQTNSKHIDNYEDLRFRDAAQTVFFKYHMMGVIQPSGGTTTTAPAANSVHMVHQRQETIVRSGACIIL
jgi:hypothetical protein